MSDLPLRPGQVSPRPLARITERLAAAQLSGDGGVSVTGVTHDSRQVVPGDLYIARSGAHTHGIDHVASALAAGAVAVLTDPLAAARAAAAGATAVVTVPDPQGAMGPAAAWVYGDPGDDLLLLGVTGTNGKTTTAYLLAAGLVAAGHQAGLLGTIETRIGDVSFPSARTTPEATDLHALLAVMRERGVDAVALEVSSHALALGRVAGIQLDVAAFTNLSQDHLDFHGDMAGYFAAKAALFTPELARQGVVCVDDEWGARLAASARIPVTTTGSGAAAHWRRSDGPVTAAGGRTRLHDPAGGSHELCCRLVGGVNLSNAALAYVSLVVAGVDPAAAGEGIASLPGIPGRMERVEAGQEFLALVDYAHTPEALRRALDECRRLGQPGGRVLVVVGCGGDRDRAKRPLMGAAAAVADRALLTSDNPRSEDPERILAEMLTGVPAGAAVTVQPDRRAAIASAVAQARPGDVLLVAGKGHESGQESQGVLTPFDDRSVLRESIAASLDARTRG